MADPVLIGICLNIVRRWLAENGQLSFHVSVSSLPTPLRRLYSSPEHYWTSKSGQVTLKSAVDPPQEEKEVPMNQYSLIALRQVWSSVGGWARRHYLVIVWLLSFIHIALAHAHSWDSGSTDEAKSTATGGAPAPNNCSSGQAGCARLPLSS